MRPKCRFRVYLSEAHMRCPLWAAVCSTTDKTCTRAPGRMPKGVWREMFKAAAVHTNKHPLLSNSNRHTHTEARTHARTSTHSHSSLRCLATDSPPSVPYASVPANYKRSNQFHQGPHPGNWTPVTPATRRLSLYLTATYTQPQSEPGSSSLCSTPP